MLLEHEIQQKSFKSPQQKLAVNLIYTSNWLNNHYDKFFKLNNLTIQQYNVLRILRGQFPNTCSLKNIKERMLDKMSDTSRVLDKLVIKGYAIRNECPDDRRSVNVLISDKGLNLLNELDIIDEATKDIFKNLPTDQIEILNKLLDNLRGN